MAELIVRDVEPALVAKLTQRAVQHRRSVEDEAPGDSSRRPAGVRVGIARDDTFEAYPRKMPDVGMDTDFSRG